ncbi:hypothetical protein MycrhDRAFT_5775 [Mycolicibacterium rhodesiae JS60]|nr:hypothetical protein MycrhDRAFT_5775 [Mycolicibacterium rhodesiae JS60]
MTNAIAEIRERVETLVEGIEHVLRENGKLLQSVKSLQDANTSLNGQLAVARRSFGEAFVKGQHFPVGPQRPNRKKLTEQEVKDIRAAWRGGMKQSDLAEYFGVNSSTISRTVRGIYH